VHLDIDPVGILRAFLYALRYRPVVFPGPLPLEDPVHPDFDGIIGEKVISFALGHVEGGAVPRMVKSAIVIIKTKIMADLEFRVTPVVVAVWKDYPVVLSGIRDGGGLSLHVSRHEQECGYGK